VIAITDRDHQRWSHDHRSLC